MASAAALRERGLAHWAVGYCVAGLVISFYALYVEHRFEEDPNYIASCDLGAIVSCTRPLSSAFSRGFGVVEQLLGEDSVFNQKNALYGIAIFALFSVLASHSSFTAANACVVISVFMNIGSLYLFIVLVYLETICLVCYATYVVNGALLVNSLRRRRLLAPSQECLKKKKTR